MELTWSSAPQGGVLSARGVHGDQRTPPPEKPSAAKAAASAGSAPTTFSSDPRGSRWAWKQRSGATGTPHAGSARKPDATCTVCRRCWGIAGRRRGLGLLLGVRRAADEAGHLRSSPSLYLCLLGLVLQGGGGAGGKLTMMKSLFMVLKILGESCAELQAVANGRGDHTSLLVLSDLYQRF